MWQYFDVFVLKFNLWFGPPLSPETLNICNINIFPCSILSATKEEETFVLWAKHQDGSVVLIWVMVLVHKDLNNKLFKGKEFIRAEV